MNKYYTPEIEEFYVGFEFEQEERVIGSTIMVKQIIKIPEDISLAFEMYNESDEAEIRVKYLDREDIESLEFLFTGKAVCDWYEKEGSFEIGNWTSYKVQLLHDVKNNWVKVIALDCGEEVEIFQGTIKNKSELKKLLKQLGI